MLNGSQKSNGGSVSGEGEQPTPSRCQWLQTLQVRDEVFFDASEVAGKYSIPPGYYRIARIGDNEDVIDGDHVLVLIYSWEQAAVVVPAATLLPCRPEKLHPVVIDGGYGSLIVGYADTAASAARVIGNTCALMSAAVELRTGVILENGAADDAAWVLKGHPDP